MTTSSEVLSGILTEVQCIQVDDSTSFQWLPMLNHIMGKMCKGKI